MHSISGLIFRSQLFWRHTLVSGLLSVALIMINPFAVYAHQPFFEDQDATASNPWRINDPSISLALYGTLQRADDVDYFQMKAKRGQRIPVQMTIPKIKGQADKFVPSLAILGPGLTPITLSLGANTIVTNGLVLPPPDKAGSFYEPFSGDNYWTWQDTQFVAPQTGEYRIVVWHARGCVGRYTLAVGAREVRGGDPEFRTKKRNFWTPTSAKPASTCNV